MHRIPRVRIGLPELGFWRKSSSLWFRAAASDEVQPVEISSFIKWEDGLECNDTLVTISIVEASRMVYNHFDFFASSLDLAFPLKWLVLYEQLLVVTNFFGVWDRYMELKSHAKIESELQSPKRRHQKFSLQCMVFCWSVTKEFQMRTIALNHISHSILFSNYILLPIYISLWLIFRKASVSQRWHLYLNSKEFRHDSELHTKLPASTNFDAED